MSSNHSSPGILPEVGAKVQLVGLKNANLNGRTGTISDYAKDGKRVKINIHDGMHQGIVKVKPRNMVVPEEPSGVEEETDDDDRRRELSSLRRPLTRSRRLETAHARPHEAKPRQHSIGGLTANNDSSFFDMSEDIEDRDVYVRDVTKEYATTQAIKLRVFQILAGGKIVPYRGDVNYGLSDALTPPDDRSDQTVYWVHAEADETNREALDKWIDGLNLGAYISDQIKRPANEWTSSVMCTKSTALVTLRVLQLKDECGTFKLDEVEYLAAIVTTGMLLTYDVTNMTSAHTTSALIAHMLQEEVLRDGSSYAALTSWLEFHVRNTKNAAIELLKDSVRMTKKLDVEPKMVNLREILDLWGRIFFVALVAEEQNHCIANMRDMDTESDDADFEKVVGSLQMLVKTAKSTEIMMERIRRRVEDLKNAFGSHQLERIYQKLSLLTVLSAIFMPLNFWAGVYGMNFENIPELSTQNGYFVWWGVMITIAIGMTTFFYIDGWFVKY
ncbi:hypothetical protein ACHAXA_010088 [Cyclostephanos tholiformis]|uniref:Uncharacterized protein n=1 Tax=Cyclostephanos tholiformis TaxID=382380 RepID=A0ABD3RQQ2_9STRA